MSARRLIANRFVIENPSRELLGRGGMGEVYRAQDTQTGETVAVKAINPEIVARSPDLLERFQREGEALRRLDHPNIVHMLAAVEQDGRHYLVMEYVGGGSLDDLLQKEGRLAPEQVVKVGLEVADALARAHHLGILHRDIKPANVLLAEDSTPRLADFGIAYQQSSPRLTQTGILVGTVDYLSPEVIQGQPPDERSDIWSFGVLLYELLSGQLPFYGENLTAKLTAILTQPTPDIAASVPGIPDALADLVYRMLEKDPQQRIPSVRLVGAEIEAIQKGREPVFAASHESRFATPAPVAGAPKHNLPAQTTPFVGREVELHALAHLLADPGVRLVSILGIGGMGKTRLAVEAGANELNHFQHGVYFVSLAPLQSTDMILSAITGVIRFSFQERGDPLQQLRGYLRDKQMLFILDNFEHLLDAVGLILDILTTAPKIKILVTSHQRLDVQVEQLFYLSGMDFPDWETPADALEYSAVKLFLQGARRASPGFELAADDLKYAARICRLVGGLPLGILLAAAWVAILSPHEIATEMDKNLDILEIRQRDMPERQRSLRAVFDYSWNLLSEREREVFQGLSVCRGGFTRQAAQAITGASLLDLMSLVNKSLLQRDSNGRFNIHELLRQYAAEKLSISGRLGQMRLAHLEYLQSLIAQCKDAEGLQLQAEWFSRLVVEVDNLRAALATCLDYGNPLAGLRMVWDLRLNMMFPGRLFGYPNALGWLNRLLAAAPEPTLERARGLIVSGHLYYSLGEYREARRILEESLDLSNDVGDMQASAEAAFLLSWTVAALGDLARAHSLLESSRAIYEELEDQVHLAFVVLVMGEMACMEGELALARQLDEQSLVIHRRLKNQYMLPVALANLAKVLIHFQEFDRAWELIRECRAIEPAVHRTNNMVIMVAAFLYNAQGQPERAARLLGFHEAQRAVTGAHIDIGDRPDFERNLAELRLRLDENVFAAAWEEGRALTWEQAIALALSDGEM